MAKKKKSFVKLKCSECGQINYYTHKSQRTRTLGKKLALKKFCKRCRKHTKHTEVKK
ncbi:50S ribosomal protein L33 [bacterium]|nr:50S ribosomal protein L33 [bacterium]